MSILAKKSESFPPVEAGLHHAICCGVYNLGTQISEKFNTVQRQVLLQWEITDLKIDIKDKNTGETKSMARVISKQYTNSLNEKATLRKDLETWRGQMFSASEMEGFELLNLLGKNCLLQIIHRSNEARTYAKISSILPLQKGTEERESENPMKSFSLDHGEEIPPDTPQWICDIIEKSEEWQDTGDLEDIPF